MPTQCRPGPARGPSTGPAPASSGRPVAARGSVSRPAPNSGRAIINKLASLASSTQTIPSSPYVTPILPPAPPATPTTATRSRGATPRSRRGSAAGAAGPRGGALSRDGARWRTARLQRDWSGCKQEEIDTSLAANVQRWCALQGFPDHACVLRPVPQRIPHNLVHPHACGVLSSGV